MSRRKHNDGEKEAPVEILEEVVAEPVVPPAPETVTLRLKQNAFVRGELWLKGRTEPFPKEEANKRLSTTQFWETI